MSRDQAGIHSRGVSQRARYRLAAIAVAVTVAGLPAVARADVISPAVPLAIGGTILLLIGLVFTLAVALIAWFVLKGIARRRSERIAAAAAAQPENAEPSDTTAESADSAPPSDDIAE